MTAIPAQQLVKMVPGVLPAGGAAQSLNGLILTNNARVPTGVVLSFPNQPAVAAYFGAASYEASAATVYFGGYDNSTAKPGALLFAQYPTNVLGVSPFVRGGSLSTMTLAQLQAVAPGTMSVTVNGVAYTSASINLAAVVSFSAAAAAIQTAFNANDAAFTGAIAPATFSATGSITGNVLSVSAVSSGTIVAGATISGTGVTSGTTVVSQLTGTAGGVGTYQVSSTQSVASETISGAYGTLTVSALTSGTIHVGQAVAGNGTSAGTVIYQAGTGTGGAGTYYVNNSQTVASGSLTSGALSVTFDSVSSAFVITGGTPGAAGTIAFPSGAIATSLNLTSATGAVSSQGAAQGVPSVNMAALNGINNQWFGFTTTWEPATSDGLNFAAWVDGMNGTKAFAGWDTDPAPAGSSSASTSFGAQLTAATYSGTLPIWSPSDQYLGAFVLGFWASLDFTRLNGRATLAFKGQSGLTAGVTDATTAANLQANGYNYYGSWSTSSQVFNFCYPGSISGKFLWADTYADQAWLNSSLRNAALTYLTAVGSVPYNADGYTGIEAALLSPITAAVNYGAIRKGVTLSSAQIAEANALAGQDISSVLQTRGWYLSVTDPGATVRSARGSPNILLIWTDGQSVQSLNIPSEVVQ
jgi:hypothetical protein